MFTCSVVDGVVGEAAAGALECSAADKVCERCRLCGDTSMYQTSTSGVVFGLSGEAAAGALESAQLGAQNRS